MKTILIVDDKPQNIQLLGSILKGHDFSIDYALDGSDAVEMVMKQDFDLILLDIEMPGTDGFTACQRIKALDEKKGIPIIFITARTDIDSIERGFELGAVDYITKPFSPKEVMVRVRNHLNLNDQKMFLEQLVLARTDELNQTKNVIIASFASVVGKRSNETGAHILRTQRYMEVLAKYLINVKGYSEKILSVGIDLLSRSAGLHDIGKVGISDSILYKPGKLSKEEFEEMKKHTIIGKEALEEVEKIMPDNLFLRVAKEIAHSHHEKWDGSGYPKGLAKQQIPWAARIMSLVDVYDALVSKRVYKKAYELDFARDFIVSKKGLDFCPEIVDAFLEEIVQFEEIATKYSDSSYDSMVINKL